MSRRPDARSKLKMSHSDDVQRVGSMDLVNQIVRYSYGPNQVEFSAIPYGTFIRSTRHIMKLPTCFGRRDDEASESWMLLLQFDSASSTAFVLSCRMPGNESRTSTTPSAAGQVSNDCMTLPWTSVRR
jgi:hypothetical protein